MTRALKATVVIAVIMTLLFIWSITWAQVKTVQSKTATVTTSKILVTKNPKVVTLKQPASSKYVVAPKPLTSTQKQAYAREMLLALGVKKVELPPLVTKVRLTPDVPRSGFNWYEIYLGNNSPFPGKNLPAHTYVWRGQWGSGSTTKIRLHFERTVPNKLYMLDIAASKGFKGQDVELIFSGAVEGKTKLQNGHVVVGFVATQAVSEIEFQLNTGYFQDAIMYSIELTQVN
jgi:hypothetical protein